jgi:hypothetical protein
MPAKGTYGIKMKADLGEKPIVDEFAFVLK